MRRHQTIEDVATPHQRGYVEAPSPIQGVINHHQKNGQDVPEPEQESMIEIMKRGINITVNCSNSVGDNAGVANGNLNDAQIGGGRVTTGGDGGDGGVCGSACNLPCERLHLTQAANEGFFNRETECLTFNVRVFNISGTVIPGPILIVSSLGGVELLSAEGLAPGQALWHTVNYPIQPADRLFTGITNVVFTSTGVAQGESYLPGQRLSPTVETTVIRALQVEAEQRLLGLPSLPLTVQTPTTVPEPAQSLLQTVGEVLQVVPPVVQSVVDVVEEVTAVVPPPVGPLVDTVLEVVPPIVEAVVDVLAGGSLPEVTVAEDAPSVEVYAPEVSEAAGQTAEELSPVVSQVGLEPL